VSRRAAAGGLGLGLGAGFNISTVGPAADMLADQYGVRLGVIGFLTTALFATHLLSQLPGGRLIDRHGARTMGMLALAVIVAGNALALTTGILTVGIAGRLVTGLGTGVGFIAGSDYVRAKLGTPTAQGLYGGFSVGGAGLAIALVPLGALSVDWRAPYLAGLVMAAVFLVVLWAAPADDVNAGALRGNPWAMLRDRRLYPLAVIHTASFGFSVILGIWTVSLFEHDGYRSEVGGVIGALTLLGGLVTRPLGGRMMERWPQRTPLYVELSMLAAAAGTLLLLLDVAIPVRVLGAATLGLAAGIPFAYAFTRAQQIRRDAPALATGFVNSCATLTILVGAPLLGFTFALPGEGAIGFAVVAALWAAAALSLRGERTADALVDTV
jgi:MFS family permease